MTPRHALIIIVCLLVGLVFYSELGAAPQQDGQCLDDVIHYNELTVTTQVDFATRLAAADHRAEGYHWWKQGDLERCEQAYQRAWLLLSGH